MNTFLRMNKHLIFFILLLVIFIRSCNAGPLNWILTRRIISNQNKNSKKTNINKNPSNPKNSDNSKKINFLESKK